MNCEFCGDKFDDLDQQPRIVPCGHSICLSCVIRAITEARNIECSDCKYDEPASKLKQFPPNFDLIKALRLFNDYIQQLTYLEEKLRKEMLSSSSQESRLMTIEQGSRAESYFDKPMLDSSSHLTFEAYETPVKQSTPKYIGAFGGSRKSSPISKIICEMNGCDRLVSPGQLYCSKLCKQESLANTRNIIEEGISTNLSSTDKYEGDSGLANYIRNHRNEDYRFFQHRSSLKGKPFASAGKYDFRFKGNQTCNKLFQTQCSNARCDNYNGTQSTLDNPIFCSESCRSQEREKMIASTTK